MKNLAGKYCVVTGAGKGIGKAIAKRFLEEEAAGVAIWEFDPALAEATARELDPDGKKVIVVRCNVADSDQVKQAVDTVKRAAALPGVKAVIFRSPCVALEKSHKQAVVDADACIGCRKCIRELGCPGLILKGGKAAADPSLCTGCMLCAQICPKDAISLKTP